MPTKAAWRAFGEPSPRFAGMTARARRDVPLRATREASFPDRARSPDFLLTQQLGKPPLAPIVVNASASHRHAHHFGALFDRQPLIEDKVQHFPLPARQSVECIEETFAPPLLRQPLVRRKTGCWRTLSTKPATEQQCLEPAPAAKIARRV